MFLIKALLTILLLSNHLFAQEVVLAVDTDRDGVVDYQKDERGKAEWSDKKGAVFLFNNDDDDENGERDFLDTRINGRVDLEDFSQIKLIVKGDLERVRSISISVDKHSREYINIFSTSNLNQPIPLQSPHNIQVSNLIRGEETLVIEAKSYSDEHWTGQTKVKVAVVLDDGSSLEDVVALRVAPFILSSSLSAADKVFVREYRGRNDRFIESLQSISLLAGFDLVVVPDGTPYPAHQVWMQDAFELGYSSQPGHWMTVALPAHRNRSLDSFPIRERTGVDFGWIKVGEYRKKFASGGGGNGWLDWFGNLEVTPPTKRWPFGRVLYGKSGSASLNPKVVDFLKHQKVQGPPIAIDTSWLQIKHVDEVVNFVPSREEGRFKVLIVSPKVAIDTLNSLDSVGYGDVRMLAPFEKQVTVSSLLANQSLISANLRRERKYIEPIIDQLKRELDLEESDFIRVPALFTRHGKSMVPNMVNSLVANGHFVSADPHGPIVNNEDVFQKYLEEQFRKLPIEIHFVDDRMYHRWSGNVHCATNAQRQRHTNAWWEMPLPDVKK